MAGVDDDWLELEIQRQLLDLSMEDVELEGDHEFGCHGDNQDYDIAKEDCFSEDVDDLETVDISKSIFGSYLEKLEESEDISKSLLGEAQQLLCNVRVTTDTDSNEENRGSQITWTATSETSCDDRASSDRARTSYDITRTSSRRDTSGRKDCIAAFSTSEESMEVWERQLDDGEARRRSVVITGHGNHTSWGHHQDNSSGSKTSMLLYNPEDQLLTKCPDPEDQLFTKCPDPEDNSGDSEGSLVAEEETEDEKVLTAELRLRQDSWMKEIQELERQRMEHCRLLEERQVQARVKQNRAACKLQSVVRGWMTRNRIQPLIHKHRAWNKQQEESQARSVLLLQARCRGWGFRRSMNVEDLKDRRRKLLEDISLCVTNLQARARGKLLRDAILEHRLMWRELRGVEGTGMVSRLQAYCRGYLLRRITTCILQNIRQTRIREAEAKHKDVKKESKGKVITIQSKHSKEILTNRGKDEANKSFEIRIKKEVGKAMKKSEHKVKSKAVNKVMEETSRNVILLQARLRGVVIRRKLQVSAVDRSFHLDALTPEDKQQSSLNRHHQLQLPTPVLQQQTAGSPQMVETEDQHKNQHLKTHPLQYAEGNEPEFHQLLQVGGDETLVVDVAMNEVQEKSTMAEEKSTGCTGVATSSCSELQKPVLTNSVRKSSSQTNTDERDNMKKKMVDEIYETMFLAEECRSEPVREAIATPYQTSVSADMVDLARESRARSTYMAELQHASQPLSGHALLGVLVERLSSWQEAQKKRKKTRLTYNTTDGGMTMNQYQSPSCESDSDNSPLTSAQLLAASPDNTSLGKVVQVHVQNSSSPPALSSLKVCRQLLSLTLSGCALSTLAGLQGCSQLCQLQVPRNEIKKIGLDASVCGRLRFVDLSSNNLASIHGLQHCHDLLHLSLANNKLARVINLQHNPLLTHLHLKDNLLINSKGLEVLTELESVILSDNHLVQAEGLHNSFCLQHLSLSQNNLQELPGLDSHVLLVELVLDNNNLSDISSITSAWLPRLCTLYLSNNCVSRMDSLACAPMLSILDLAHNSIYDLPVLLQSLHGCFNLKVLAVAGNPVTEEPRFRTHLHHAVPSLQSLDGCTFNHMRSKVSNGEPPIPGVLANSHIYQMCKKQEETEHNLKEKHSNVINALGRVGASGDINAARAALEARVKYNHDFHNILKQHLAEWERVQPLQQQHTTQQQRLSSTAGLPDQQQYKTQQQQSTSTAGLPDQQQHMTQQQSTSTAGPPDQQQYMTQQQQSTSTAGLPDQQQHMTQQQSTSTAGPPDQQQHTTQQQHSTAGPPVCLLKAEVPRPCDDTAQSRVVIELDKAEVVATTELRIQISNGLGEIEDKDGNGLGEVLGDKDHNGSVLVCAEETVQDSWRGWKNRKERFSFQLEQAKVEREQAAIVIQAAVRGHLLRKRLLHIMDMSGEDEQNTEVDGQRFLELFDESELEKEMDQNFGPLGVDDDSVVFPDVSTHCMNSGSKCTSYGGNMQRRSLPSRHQVSPTHDVNLLPGATTDAELCCHQSFGQATTNVVQSCKHSLSTEGGQQHCRTPTTGFLPLAVSNDLSSPTTWSHPSGCTEKQQKELKLTDSSSTGENRRKQEELSKEWGLSSSTTAKLMLKRANRQKKLEKTAIKRKLMADPAVRLAWFRRHGLHQTKNLVQQTSAGKEQQIQYPSTHHQADVAQVFRWKPGDTGLHEPTADFPAHTMSHTHLPDGTHAHSPSEHSKGTKTTRLLPDLEPHVLAGYSTRLISSESLNKQVLKGASQHSNAASKRKSNLQWFS